MLGVKRHLPKQADEKSEQWHTLWLSEQASWNRRVYYYFSSVIILAQVAQSLCLAKKSLTLTSTELDAAHGAAWSGVRSSSAWMQLFRITIIRLCEYAFNSSKLIHYYLRAPIDHWEQKQQKSLNFRAPHDDNQTKPEEARLEGLSLR